MKRYRNREDAGRRLAEEIAPSYPDNPDLVVLGLARGGVAVAVELAERLHAPMDILVMRKLGVPGHPEMAMGALASGGVRVLNKYIIAYLDISEEVLETVTDAEKKKLNHREITYRGMAPPLNLAGKTVILVDDGLATGATMRAAVHAVRARMAARVVVAVPVAAPDSLESIAQEADDGLSGSTAGVSRRRPMV